MTPSQGSAESTVYSASLYGLSATTAIGEKEKDLPLINQLPLGPSAPRKFRLNDRDGWMAFSDGGKWRAVPWSLDAFRAMARGVLLRLKAAPAAAPTENADKRQGCGRPDDDPQFNLPYNLILGDMTCPSDTALARPTTRRTRKQWREPQTARRPGHSVRMAPQPIVDTVRDADA